MGFSAKISTKNLVPIFENSQGQCPRKDFRIFPDLSGKIRILISCPNFFLKKINFLFLFFVKNLYFFLLFLGFSAKFRFKKSCPNFRKFPRSMSQNPHFPTTHDVLDDEFRGGVSSREVVYRLDHLLVRNPFILQSLGTAVIDVVYLGNLVQSIDARIPSRQSLFQMRPRSHVLITGPMKFDPSLSQPFLHIETPS